MYRPVAGRNALWRRKWQSNRVFTPLNSTHRLAALLPNRPFSTAAEAAEASASTPASNHSRSIHPKHRRIATDYYQSSLTFAHWCNNNSVQFGDPSNGQSTSSQRIPVFGLRKMGSQIGIVAQRDIKQGQQIINLPWNITLGVTSPYQTLDASSLLPTPVTVASSKHIENTLNEITANIPSTVWQLTLGIRLLYEMISNTSYWNPYIHLLPLSYSTPIFYKASEIDALQYKPIQQQIRKRCELLFTISKLINDTPSYRQLFGGTNVTPDLLAWAMSAVSTRVFKFGDQMSGRRLLPLIDMLNHSFHANATVTVSRNDDNSIKSVLVHATRDISSNEEITINYGDQSNDTYLLDYGFIMDHNPFDVVEVKCDIGNIGLACDMAGHSTSMPAWKHQLFRNANSDSMTFTIGRHFDQSLCNAIRIMLAKDSDPRRETHPSFNAWYQSMDQQEEMAVYQCQHEFLSLVISSFPTTIQEDIDELSATIETTEREPDLSYTPEQMAIRYRLSKKRVSTELKHKVQLLIQTPQNEVLIFTNNAARTNSDTHAHRHN